MRPNLFNPQPGESQYTLIVTFLLIFGIGLILALKSKDSASDVIDGDYVLERIDLITYEITEHSITCRIEVDGKTWSSVVPKIPTIKDTLDEALNRAINRAVQELSHPQDVTHEIPPS